MKQQIAITVDSEILPTLDKILKSRNTPRSWFFNEAMKNEVENWTTNKR